MIPDPLVVEAAGRAGFDWVGLDMQHGAWDLGRAFRAIQLLDALEVPSVVRISQDELALLPRLCDQGAGGIVVAMVESADVATRAVNAARYQPEGRRSYGGQRYGLRPEPTNVANVRPTVYAMIEDRRGYEAVEEIASVPGLGGLHVGPVDLGLGLGLGVERSGPAFSAACARILQAAKTSGIGATMHAVRGGDLGLWRAAGWDEVVLPADMDLLRAAFREQVGAGRKDGTDHAVADMTYGRAR